MVSSKTQLAIAACLATAAHAFESISVPAAITADKSFTLTVTTNDADSAYKTYRVYLDTTPPGYTGGPSCYLQNTTSITTTSLDLTIPAGFGPDGDFYSVSTREYPDASGYTTSSTFSLTGATGNWSEYENSLMGAPLWPADDLPCSAYSCARACAMTSFPDDLTYGSDAQKTMAKCILECPGVSMPIITSSSSSGAASATSSVSSSATAAAAQVTSSGLTTSTRAVSSSSSGASATSGTATGSSTVSASSATASTGAGSINSVSVAMLAAGGVFAFLL